MHLEAVAATYESCNKQHHWTSEEMKRRQAASPSCPICTAGLLCAVPVLQTRHVIQLLLEKQHPDVAEDSNYDGCRPHSIPSTRVMT
jgi:hypothetical protein